ncbi:MAG TPA: hypothetical protein VLD62_09605 [Acidimicrobiia bacterium]|nr:hypothetical protein [Acidimicrobiia bacterium]
MTHAVVAALPAELGGVLDAHRRTCLQCQVDESRRRTLARELAEAVDRALSAPSWFVEAVMADLEHTERSRRTAALVSGLVAGAAAVTAAVLAILARRRTRPV